MSDIRSEYVELSVADGGTMRAWFSRPAKQEVRAGLMVFQEAFGVNAHIRSVADRFAKAGFAAIAPELYHRSSPGFESGYDDAAPAIALARQLTTEGLEADIRATHAFLRDQGSDNMACVGYCMGGRVRSWPIQPCRSVRRFLSTVGGSMVSLTAPQTAPRPCCSSGERKTSTSPANIARKSRKECMHPNSRRYRSHSPTRTTDFSATSAPATIPRPRSCPGI